MPASDYARFIQFHPDEPYVVLRLYLARARSGLQTGATELQSNASALKQSDWPFPVVELFLGRRTATATLAAATKPDERCEAQYYIGEWYLLHDDKTCAPPALEAAADTCPKNFDEYTSSHRVAPRPTPARDFEGFQAARTDRYRE
jgi:lipoprotein NlpI